MLKHDAVVAQELTRRLRKALHGARYLPVGPEYGAAVRMALCDASMHLLEGAWDDCAAHLGVAERALVDGPTFKEA